MKSEHVDSKKMDTLTKKEVMKTFPKIELHRHLEGTFALSTMHRIAMKNGLPLPSEFGKFKQEVQFPRDSGPDFLKFLSKFRTDWYRSLEDVNDVVYDAVRELTEDGIFYIEMRFSPEHFALQNGFDRKEVSRVVVRAANKAAAEIGVAIKYLITFNRNKQDAEQMTVLYRDLLKLDVPEIVGIDLAGDELNFPPELFKSFFDVVKNDGVYRCTIHAGEVTASTQIWDAINLLHASRIGHGTSAITDQKLQNYLREHSIALEQCITSNHQTGSWVDESNHPLGTLYRNRVPVTINSDDPFIQDTDLTDDYIKAVKYFDLGVDDLVRMNMTALECSFLPDQEKMKLGQEYVRKVNDFRATHEV
ncbi:MAG TPA: adenosine deaminase [Spirochaetia bacterium]|nr:adenosine deaminase [Spirochaetia bacterium]